jgi:uncharacterized protein YdeI (BOF family)
MRSRIQNSGSRIQETCHSSPVTRRVLAGALSLAAAVVLTGCASGYTRVREIMAAPDSFVGKEVRLQGTVGKAIDPPRPQAYMLRDETGEIMVVTRSELPAQDSEVALKGVVRGSVVRGSRWTFDVRVEESERLR